MAGILSFLSSLGLIGSPSLTATTADGCHILCLLIRQKGFHFSTAVIFLKQHFLWKIIFYLSKVCIHMYSCLENPMDGGAWQAAVHGVAKSWTRLSNFTFMHWRRKWKPTPVFLPGESQGRGSLVGYHLWGRTESDTTEVTQQTVFGVPVRCGTLYFPLYGPLIICPVHPFPSRNYPRASQLNVFSFPLLIPFPPCGSA